jgi:hypothetical protein
VAEILIRADEGNWVRYRTDDGAAVIRDTGTLLPRSFEACFPDDRGGPELHLRIEMRGGIPQIRQLLLLCPPDGREIRQSDARSVDLDLCLEIACQLAALHVTDELDTGGIMAAHSGAPADLATVARSVSRARRNTRRQIPDDKLHLVAEVYQANPGRPTAAVAERFGLALRTASLYVKRAREAGLLEEDTDGGR